MDIKLYEEELYFVRTLDEMKGCKKNIFGAGYLISNKKAREIGNLTQTESEKTIRFNLSMREQEIVKRLEEGSLWEGAEKKLKKSFQK